MVQTFNEVFNLLSQDWDRKTYYISTFSSNVFGGVEVDIPTECIIIESITLKKDREEIRDFSEMYFGPDEVYSIDYRVVGYDSEFPNHYYYTDNEMDHGRFFDEEYEAYDYYQNESQSALNYTDRKIEEKQEELRMLEMYRSNIAGRKSANFENWTYAK